MNRRELSKCYKLIKKIIPNRAILHPSDLVPSICNKLEMPTFVERHATEIASKIDNMAVLEGKSPISIAAASVYMAAQLLDADKKKSYREVANAAQSSDATVRHTYKEIFKWRYEVIPAGLASKETIRDMITP